MLIGICGKAGAGKDTIGDFLVEKYKFKKIALADPIKRLVKDVFALDDHTVYDKVAREQDLDRWKGWTVRMLLQYIGTELFRENIDDAIWVKSLWYKIQDDKESNYVVTDLRFPNEIQYFKDNAQDGEFLSIKVVRPGYDGFVGLEGHASEAYDLETEILIKNVGTMEELYNEVNAIIEDHICHGLELTKEI